MERHVAQKRRGTALVDVRPGLGQDALRRGGRKVGWTPAQKPPVRLGLRRTGARLEDSPA